MAGELLLAMAIPFIAIEGYHTLLDSRAGRFVEEPGRHDPGWRAIVEPTPVVAVVEVDRDVVTGVALLIHHPEVRSAATVVLVPGTLELEGAPLAGRAPDEAAAVLGRSLRLSINRIEVADSSRWPEVLGDDTHLLDSPDPVVDDVGDKLFAVGPVTVDGATAAAFLGRPAPGAPSVSVLPRRHLFWNAVLTRPPTTDTELAADVRSMADAAVQVVDLPVTELEPVALLDAAAAEALVRDVVAYPAGAVPGDRLQVRVLDRTGLADLERIAAAVAAHGMEVIEIGNAWQFDGGETRIIVPVALTDDGGALPDDVGRLARWVGAPSVTVDNEAIDDRIVTLVIGGDVDLANLH